MLDFDDKDLIIASLTIIAGLVIFADVNKDALNLVDNIVSGLLGAAFGTKLIKRS